MSIASLLLAFLSAAAATVERFELGSRPAQLSRPVVWPVPKGPPGRRTVDPRRLSGRANRYRRRKPDLARRYHVEGVPAFIVVDRHGTRA